MGRLQKFFKSYWLPILSGILMGTSYIPFPPWALWFCFAPLWFQVLKNSRSVKQAFFSGWWTQFVLSLIGFHWISFVSHEYGYLPWWVSVLVLLLFASTVHLYFAVAAGLTKWVQLRFCASDGAALAVGVSLLSLGESFWPSLFPWNLGYPLLAAHSPWAQWADSLGFWGLSLVLHALNALIAYLLIRAEPRRALTTLAGVAAVLALGFWGGLQKRAHWEQIEESATKSLKVLLIQANIGNIDKYYAEKGAGFQQEIFNQYTLLTESAVAAHPEADLVVWPESAAPFDLNSWHLEKRYGRQFVALVQKIRKPLLTGGRSSDPPTTANPREYNGLFLFGPDGTALAPAYHKTFLLAYGEYTPGYSYFPMLAKISPAGVGFGLGPGPTTVPFMNSLIGLQICYEGLYPSFTEALAKRGADYLINLTNDSWFGPSFEPQQHLYMTLGRALESRLPLIRATNTGISTVVRASGSVGELSPLYEPWSGIFEIKVRDAAARELTFYTKYGSFFPWILLAALALFVAVLQRRNSRER